MPGHAMFIVVGAGPSGASLAARLAHTRSRPSVLLIEAGGPNDDKKDRVASERHRFWTTSGLHLDYGYQTTPQPALGGRRLHYHRGKGLGGSTATNLGIWDWGSKSDMDEWARRVGDDAWSWGRIENYHDESREAPTSNHTVAHGTRGPVDVTVPAWHPHLHLLLDAVSGDGLALNPDLSSDASIGFGVPPATIIDGLRVTASSAYLADKPSNLEILAGSQVVRVLCEGNKAIGVELSRGDRLYASHEVIICAGAIDTPKLLLLSGIGPSAALSRHGIHVVADLPGVGSHLMDHPMIRIAAHITAGVHGADNDAGVSVSPSTELAASGHGYFTLDAASYPELECLDSDTKRHLTDPGTRAYELICRITPSDTGSGFIWNAVMVMMNGQSRGHVSLGSRDAAEPPIIDLNFLANHYDVRATTEAIKRTARLLLQNPVIQTSGGLSPGPQTLEDSDILSYIRENLSHLWHAAGTAKMGKPEDADACVTPDFKVVGVESLRVADLSVLPIMVSNHTQSTAYLIGEVAAEKISAEYALDGSRR